MNDSFDRNIAKFLSNLESHRSKADYGYIPSVSEVKAIKNLEKSEKFVNECQKFL